MQETRVMMVTPMQAMEWLKHNENNRRIRHAVVERYAAMMAAGEWPLTHQGIALGEDGCVLDGQHRLLALKKSGVTLPMSVTFNVPTSAYPYFDMGVKRSMEDAVREQPKHVQIANLVLRLAMDKGGATTPFQVRAAISILAPFLIKLDELGTTTSQKYLSAAGVRTAAIVTAMLNKENADYSFGLYRDLVLGHVENLPPIASAIIRQIVVGDFTRGFDGVGSGSSYQFFCFFKMFPVFHEKSRHLKRIPVMDEATRIVIRQEIRRRVLDPIMAEMSGKP